jgi:hypothetical protein
MSLQRAFLYSVLCVTGLIGMDTRTIRAQSSRADENQFGPVVRAYLKYLDDEQNVVDDRVSRREVSARYYQHNLDRIKALRETAIRIARESGNDYLPEFEAATVDEFKTLFEHPPDVSTFKTGEVINNTFRFLGIVRNKETFYIFARLDPYEQADLMKKSAAQVSASQAATSPETPPDQSVRPRRAKNP